MERMRKTKYITPPDDDRIAHLLNEPQPHIRKYIETQSEKIRILTEISVALSAEKNLGRFLEKVVEETRNVTNADGGTLYIMSDDKKELRFAVVQTGTMDIRMGGTSGEITWEPVSLFNGGGSPNYSNVSAYAALSGNVVNIPEVYDADGFNFEGTRVFDAKTGYRSKSMLVVPMRNHENDIIGVLQLLNARDPVTGEVVPFSEENQHMTESLASQAAVALTNNLLIQGLENLLESFIKSIAAAIDEKSSYTGGHIRRVADLTTAIVKKINGTSRGTYANTSFNEDEMRELQIAAWLHDVGKITTPEHVIDKATKLETVYDRIEVLKTRFEAIKREHEIGLIKEGASDPEDPAFNETLKEEMDFLVKANYGREWMDDEMIERVKRIAERQWTADGRRQPLLTDDEIRCLSVRSGTLTDEERGVVNNHAAITYKILSQLPFPKKLRHVPAYAAAHHEKINGSGYPLGLEGDQIPLQSRILALADIFEALTAKDRPYKKGKTLSEAIAIMEVMAKNNEIDPELFRFFMDERIHLDYADKELSPNQRDMGRVR